MKFLANENIPKTSIVALRRAGHVVTSVQEEMAGASDETVLKRAHAEGLIILTFDKGYGRLIYQYTSSLPTGVVYFRLTPASPEEVAGILLTLLARPLIALDGKYTVIDRTKVRQRPLSD